MPSLIVLDGPNQGAVFTLLPDRNRVGRDPLSEVVVLDEAASRAHAEVIWDASAERFRLRDLGSRNGTILNGFPAEGETELQAGDELRVGESVLLFNAEDAPPLRTGRSTLILPGEARDPELPAAPPLGLEPAPRLLGESPLLRKVLTAASRCARLDVSVLILGETGTGKELVAEAIHRASPRRAGPLVTLNAATLTGALCESELFGHERGAFTGALARRAGCFERADGGTLVLDEIGELPSETQAKLLRVLETQAFSRLGGAEAITSDFRLVAATHRDLHAMVEEGTFRADLLFRFDVARLRLPPLRERKGDVKLLAEFFLRTLAARMASPVRGIDPEGLALLEQSPFPGNVRELRNWIERALIFAEHEVLSVKDLQGAGGLPSPATRVEGDEAPILPLAEVERREIERALRATEGNKTRAALLLGIDRKTLYGKIQRHGLEP